MIDFNEIFNDSYERVHRDPERFYDAFYKNLMAKSQKIKDMFKNVDMITQKSMLQDSMGYLISFYSTKQAHSYLLNLANSHTKQLSVTNEMYEWWLDSMIATAKEFDPKFKHEVEVAWRIVLAPGLTFMKSYPKQ